MSIYVLGFNHDSAPVALREQLALAPQQLSAHAHELKQALGVSEFAVLSTCNRTEYYARARSADSEPLLKLLQQKYQIDDHDLATAHYWHEGPIAVRHLMRVATGLDSLVLGEPQILGQIKQAYQEQREATLGPILDRLFQNAFSVAKQVRTHTDIGSGPVSVAFAAVHLARQVFGDFARRTALLVGSGETIELAGRHLRERQLGAMVIANRTFANAHQLAATLHATAIPLAEVESALPKADVIITSTGSPQPIIKTEWIRQAIKQRRHQPMLIVDIAVPRDVEASAADLEDVYLYTVDDLRNVVEQGMDSRKQAALQAEQIVSEGTQEYLKWLRQRRAHNLIGQFRSDAEAQRDKLVNDALKRLQSGQDVEDTLKNLAQRLTAKLIHGPSAGLREVVTDHEDEQILDLARQVLKLQDDEEQQ